ncbi:protein kinase domain-containing protein [Acaryochloris marina NIES-2412]|uniref:protein kinase domain-containing protein n=1 Tax=Acaryochloris marina TaxID=155978 RepID=UPI0040581680
MRYCLNPWCSQRQNTDDVEVCQKCGTSLLIHDRFWLIRSLRPLDEDAYFDIFDAIDTTGSYISPPGSIKILKVLRRRAYGYEELIPVIENEADALKLLNHPGIPRCDIDDSFTWSFTHEDREVELYCLAMQKFEGEPLDDWLETHGPISQEQALDWLKQMADILHYVHQVEIIHRDIKPSNILVRPDETLALIDFGGADIKGYSMESPPNRPAPPIATLGYTPKEQIRGEALPESDFYTLGLTMISAVCGKPQNEISYDPKTFELLWRQEARHIDPPLADFIDRLSSKRVWDRPRNYELVDLVEQLPDQIKRYQKFRSPWFKVGVGLSILALLFGAYKGTTFIVSQYYFREGTIKLYEDKLKEAKSDLRIAIQFDPGHASAYHNLASACLEEGKIDCAFTNFKKALELDPERWTSYYQIGNYYDDEKQYDQAAKYYQKAIKVGGDQAGKAINNLARIRILQEDYQDAIRIATEGISLSAKSPNLQISLYKNRGWAKLELKQYDAALKDLIKASEITETQEHQRADPFCVLAQVYEAKKDTLQANIHWEMCLRMPSNTPEVARWRYEVIDRLFDFE